MRQTINSFHIYIFNSVLKLDQIHVLLLLVSRYARKVYEHIY